MITLYHSPFTRSHLSRFAVEEAGLPHDIVRVDVSTGAHKGPDYLRVNPLGQLPALRDGDLVICESAAIALYVGDRAPAERALAPAIGSRARAEYYHWIAFSVATELIALAKIVMHTSVLPENMRSSVVLEEGRGQWASVAALLSRAVKGRRFLLGDAFTMADVMVGGALWLAGFIEVLAPYPELVDYHGRVRERPAFARAFSDARAP